MNIDLNCDMGELDDAELDGAAHEAALAALETRGRENVTNRCRVELALEHSGFEAALARRNA